MSSAFEHLDSELAQAVRHARESRKSELGNMRSWSGFLCSSSRAQQNGIQQKTGRNSIGIDIDPAYCRMAERRLERETRSLFGQATVTLEEPAANNSNGIRDCAAPDRFRRSEAQEEEQEAMTARKNTGSVPANPLKTLMAESLRSSIPVDMGNRREI